MSFQVAEEPKNSTYNAQMPNIFFKSKKKNTFVRPPMFLALCER